MKKKPLCTAATNTPSTRTPVLCSRTDYFRRSLFVHQRELLKNLRTDFDEISGGVSNGPREEVQDHFPEFFYHAERP